jgi:alpha-glucosidase
MHSGNVFIRFITFVTVIGSSIFRTCGQDSLSLSSPNGKIVFNCQLSEKGSLSYGVNYTGQPVILTSQLGVDGWQYAFTLKEVSRNQRDTTWKPVYGERAVINDKYREAVFVLWRQNQEKQQLHLQVRAYNEGIAFRYIFPEHADGGRDISIRNEFTNFVMPAGTKAWFTGGAQSDYQLLPLQAWPGESERPLTMQLPDGKYVAIGEAGMVDYARTKFSLDATAPNTIRCSQYDRVDVTTPFATPWRVIMPAEKPAGLLANNDIFLNLNEPCKLDNTDWIKPGT